MATEAQISANRINAQKSTGPRTPEGKAVASQNAVTHGFLARETVLQGEDPGEFALYRDWKLRDLAPVGDAELDMAERIVGLSWRLRRAERLQTEAFDALYEKMATGAPGGGMSAECVSEPGPGTAGGAESDADRLLGRMLVDDFSNSRVLERLLLYERRIENSLYRSLRELREQKRMRLAGALVEPVGRVPAGASRGTGIPSVSLSGQALPVSWDHGRDAHATATPAGVATGLWPAQESLCKTNPKEVSSVKWEVSSKGRQAVSPPGLPTSNFPPETLTQPQLCKTNPMCEGIGVQGSGIRDLTPDSRPLTPGLSCKTNPNFAGTRETGVFEAEKGGSASAAGGSEETKPISWGDPSSLPAVRRVA